MMVEALKHSELEKLVFYRVAKLSSSLFAPLSHHRFINWGRNGAERDLVFTDKRRHMASCTLLNFLFWCCVHNDCYGVMSD